ncbi:MAG: hypothetical protein A3G23_04375 [Bacteroidetes bacterium RIFCSPLOWO2_12_FULL_37_12]|nr:MAG: hypothetical protein A3G23_04375 [Bacteroidetes bacterium RIFCSPLOWO2_12_FULL_37_12]
MKRSANLREIFLIIHKRDKKVSGFGCAGVSEYRSTGVSECLGIGVPELWSNGVSGVLGYWSVWAQYNHKIFLRFFEDSNLLKWDCNS